QPPGQILAATLVQQDLIHQGLGGIGQAFAAVQGRVAGGNFRSAAKAGAVAGFLSAGGAGKEVAVGSLGGAHPANRPAVDSGAGNADKKPSIKARVATK